MRHASRLVVIAGFAAFLLWRECPLLWPGVARVHIFDVGQGSAALIVSAGGKRALIDGGPDARVLEGLHRAMPFLSRRIDLVVLSHPDSDHLTGLLPVLERYDVGAILLSGVAKTSARYDTFLALAARDGIPILIADPLRDIILDTDVLLDIVWPPPPGRPRPSAANDLSVTVRVISGSASVLLPGDISERAEKLLLTTGQTVDSDVLVLGHHGSRTSTATGFLLAVSPHAAVVSVGAENRYGHPHPSILARLAHFGIALRSTALEGDIVLQMSDIQ